MKIKNALGKIIGLWNEKENTFSKKVSATKHLFRKLNAWGIDGQVFNSLLLPNNATIQVYDTDSANTYITTAQTYLKEGTWLHFKGHETQIFLPVTLFQKRDKQSS